MSFMEECLNKLWYAHTTKPYSAIKRHKLWKHTTSMNLKKLGLVKKPSQSQVTRYMIPLDSVVEMTRVEMNDRLEVTRDLEGRRVKGN